MRFVIVTGMSGAGKSSVLKMLEDVGYFCVDNLPIQLINKFAQLAHDENSKIDKVALGIDIRSGQDLDEIDEILKDTIESGYKHEILFLESSTQVLIKRYKETRRTHPLLGEGRVEDGIELERIKLAFLKKSADYIIDSSQLLIKELRSEVEKIFVHNEDYDNLFITVLSFGFKYGIPADSDLVFDVRFLPNPFYLPELRPKTGNDIEVKDFVMKTGEADKFLDQLNNMLRFLLPNYIQEGRNQLVVSIGCTGGKHRSVTIANKITEKLLDLGHSVKVQHRDIMKDFDNTKES